VLEQLVAEFGTKVHPLKQLTQPDHQHFTGQARFL
jgi:hypothetical protein